jgi:hypothetical protein
MNYKKTYETIWNYTNEVMKIAKDMKFEMIRISRLWDKTEEMRYTLFTKKEILKLMTDEMNDFEESVRIELTKLLDEIKKESGESIN